MATDNVMAGVAGGLGAVNDVLDTYIKYKLQSKLKRQDDYINAEDIPEDLRQQIGVSEGGGIRKEVLPFYTPTVAYNPQTGTYETVSKFRSNTARTPTANQKQFINQSELTRRISDGEKLNPENFSVNPDKPQISEEDKVFQRERAKRMATKPKALASFKSADANLQSLVDSIDELVGDKDLSKGSGISGVLMGNLPGTKARDIRAKIQTIKSKTSLNALQEMRANSPTGGALGNVSDAEGARLESNIAALDLGQSDEALLGQLKKLRSSTVNSQARIREAYQTDFEESAPKFMPPVLSNGGGGSGLTPEQRRARIAELKAKMGQ